MTISAAIARRPSKHGNRSMARPVGPPASCETETSALTVRPWHEPGVAARHSRLRAHLRKEPLPHHDRALLGKMHLVVFPHAHTVDGLAATPVRAHELAPVHDLHVRDLACGL